MVAIASVRCMEVVADLRCLPCQPCCMEQLGSRYTTPNIDVLDARSFIGILHVVLHRPTAAAAVIGRCDFHNLSESPTRVRRQDFE